MKFINQIKAYSMLLIMLFVMIHNAFPHVHHQHDTVDMVATDGEFHHHGPYSDHHHHSDENGQDHEKKNILDFFFNNHSHTSHLYQYTSTVVGHVKSKQQLYSKVSGDSDIWVFPGKKEHFVLQMFVLQNDFVPDPPYLHFYGQRGPPSLG